MQLREIKRRRSRRSRRSRRRRRRSRRSRRSRSVRRSARSRSRIMVLAAGHTDGKTAGCEFSFLPCIPKQMKPFPVVL